MVTVVGAGWSSKRVYKMRSDTVRVLFFGGVSIPDKPFARSISVQDVRVFCCILLDHAYGCVSI